MINREKFVTDILRYASTIKDPLEIINEMLRYLGHALNADRAYIFEEVDGVCFNNTFEWCREGVESEMEFLQEVPYEVCEVWYKEYDKNSNIIIRDIEEYRSVSEAMYNVLKPQDIHSLITGPLELDGKYIGFWGVDNPPADELDDISAIITLLTYTMSIMIRYRNSVNEITRISMHDQLTGVFNRHMLDRRDTELRGCSSVAVLMCDINGLKQMNDTKGHAAGDELIVNCAKSLSKAFGKDNVYRVGGDEFTVICADITESDFVSMRDKAISFMELTGVTASVGYVYYPNTKYTVAQMMKEADVLMYEDKRKFYSDKKDV